MKIHLYLACLGAALWMASTAQAEDAAAGAEIYAAGFVNCHGKSGKGMASFPSLAGRDQSYISMWSR